MYRSTPVNGRRLSRKKSEGFVEARSRRRRRVRSGEGMSSTQPIGGSYGASLAPLRESGAELHRGNAFWQYWHCHRTLLGA